MTRAWKARHTGGDDAADGGDVAMLDADKPSSSGPYSRTEHVALTGRSHRRAALH
jgi:hypothetical protein